MNSEFLLRLLLVPLIFWWSIWTCAALSSDEKSELKYEFTKTKPGVYEIKLISAPSFVIALGTAPKEREPILKKGTWLVLNVSVLSATDQLVAQTAFRAITNLQNGSEKIKLAIRPFLDYKEFSPWFPEGGKLEVSPVWIVIRDGKVLGFRTGGILGSDEKKRVEKAKKWVMSTVKSMPKEEK